MKIFSNKYGFIWLIGETASGIPLYRAIRHRGKSLETTNIDTAHAWLS